MPVIYLRHPKHGTKVAMSHMEARDDYEWGWEEYDPNDPEEMESPAPFEEGVSGVSANELSVKRRRKSSATA